MKRILILVAFLIGCMVMANAQDLDEKYGKDLLKPGTVAPDFLFFGERKDTVNLKTLRDSYLVLDFWASWCGDCRKDMPAMEALSKKYNDGSVNFVGVSFDTDSATWKKCIKDTYKLRGEQVSELKKWKETKISKDYHINWIPTMYLIDPRGKVDLATVDIHKLEKRLEELQATDSLAKYKEIMPQFKGGISALMKYLSDNLVYPKECQKIGLQARVAMSFVVEKDGSISDIKESKYELINPVDLSQYNLTQDSLNRYLVLFHQLFTRSAIRVVQKMPKWEPGIQRGKPVRVKFMVPLTFKLQ